MRLIPFALADTLKITGIHLLGIIAGLMIAAPVQAQDEPEANLPSIHIGIILPAMPADQNDLMAPVAKAAMQGAAMAQEEFTFNASLIDADFAVATAEATGADAAVRAAEHLVTDEKVFALAGGFNREEALALSQWSAQHDVPFLNLGSASDELRNEQ